MTTYNLGNPYKESHNFLEKMEGILIKAIIKDDTDAAQWRKASIKDGPISSLRLFIHELLNKLARTHKI